MKALIFAAGKGVRMLPLSANVPKPLLKVLGKSLLLRTLEILPAEVSEIFIVVGYLAEKIKEEFGQEFRGKPITYVYQAEQLGTWNALEICEAHVGEEKKFMVLNSDDLFLRKDLEKLAQEERALLTHEVPDPRRFGVIVADEDGNIADIEEGPANPKSHLVNTGVYVFDRNIFRYKPELSSRGEYLITEGIQKYIRDFPVRAVRADFWMPIGYPEDIGRAEEALRARGEI